MRYVRYTIIALIGALRLLLVWGVAIEPRLIDREEEVAAVPGLPAAWEGQRVALIADLQVGMWLANTGTVRRIVAQLVEERPALVLIAGDFIYQPGDDARDEIAEAVELIRPLPQAGIPTYAVLGNHDYSLNWRDDPKREDIARQLRAALAERGVRVLHNEAIPLPAPGDAAALYLVGIGSAWAGEDRAAAVGQVPAGAPRLVFMHNPDSFADLPAGAAPLALAAHTHGGQVRLPFTPDWSWLDLVKDEESHADGWIAGYGAPGNRLYVNRGIGFGTLPVRINCPPELTVFTLRPARP